ncbi:SAM-dependent methyltransferase [Inhella gelatinilytica]|uniref:Class I SAM-dependent methyltransferase n=1 Tax=Inhella gelatinilytica TaxID=2795030 RepID=A0A931IS66_9BURK|nr:cyclopropane-fatty-acyl-phospholipid synthase family protein [Inhella gelatinilytica]MBH9551695.1 class I SAM-dependent methyltransferase [Inhella gelatinilytica]
MDTTLVKTLTPPSDAPAAVRTVFKLLQRLQYGSLDLQLPDGSTLHAGQPLHPRAAMGIHDWALAQATLQRGDIGFAESYVEGHWSSPDLAALLTLFLRNRNALESAIYGRWWGALAYRIKHWLNRNNKAGSRRNIVAHYDLGNAFYKLWLDPSMNYSSAWFEGGRGMSLQAAQHAKMDRALQELRLAPGQRLLEIGCGWGAIAERATRHYGLQVTGITLSDEQLAYARERLGQAGLKADLRLQDYRDLTDGPDVGRYDGIVSIEMIEAVGEAYWPTYFQTVARMLKPGGRACVQSIVIRDDLFERYRRGTDFIQQYIFPGGMLPCPRVLREQAHAAGLRIETSFSFGLDYAETLKRWRADFMARLTEVHSQGFDTRFQRLWEFYLAYCEAAFETGNTDVVQVTLVKA